MAPTARSRSAIFPREAQGRADVCRLVFLSVGPVSRISSRLGSKVSGDEPRAHCTLLNTATTQTAFVIHTQSSGSRAGDRRSTESLSLYTHVTTMAEQPREGNANEGALFAQRGGIKHWGEYVIERSDRVFTPHRLHCPTRLQRIWGISASGEVMIEAQK